MKTARVIGQRIVHVEQHARRMGQGMAPHVDVFQIVLENGVKLRPLVIEGDPEHAVDMVIANKPARFHCKLCERIFCKVRPHNCSEGARWFDVRNWKVVP